MTSLNRVDHTTLLSCFFHACEKQFRFLEVDHGFHYISGLSQHRNGRQIIYPYKDGQNVEAPFHAVTRYEKDQLAIEISYGEENFILNCFLYVDHIHRLHFLEVLKAAKKTENLQTQDFVVSHESSLNQAIIALSHVIKDQHKLFSSYNPKLIDKALALRETLLENNIRERLRQDVDYASTEAAKAFVEKNFLKVIQLLKPYCDFLNSSDKKKLFQSMKKVGLEV